jgi:hypothetical protein
MGWRKQFRIRKRVWVSLAVLVAVVLGVANWKPAPIVVVANGSSGDMGRAEAAAMKWQTRLLIEGYVTRSVCDGDPVKLIKARQRASEAWKGVPPVYAEELAAFAESAEVDPQLLAFGNCFVDLGSRALGCRSAVIDGDRMLHAHNLDWDNLGGMAKWSVVITRRAPDDGRLRTVSVGFAGLLGTVDVINEKGVALSFNQLGTGADVVEEPVFLMMRRIAENCADFESARQEILNAPAGMPFIITLSSATERRGAIYERWFDELSERPLNASGWVAAANNNQREQHGASCLGRQLQAEPVRHVEALKGALRHPDVLAAFNLYSVIFDFTDNKLHLASGSLPAAMERYRVYELFE